MHGQRSNLSHWQFRAPRAQVRGELSAVGGGEYEVADVGCERHPTRPAVATGQDRHFWAQRTLRHGVDRERVDRVTGARQQVAVGKPRRLRRPNHGAGEHGVRRCRCLLGGGHGTRTGGDAGGRDGQEADGEEHRDGDPG